MEWILNRRYPKKDYTIGELKIDGRWFSSTLEDTDRGLNANMSLDAIKKVKVPDETAIPKGRYKITFTYSPKYCNRTWAKPYGGKVIGVANVPGFEGIRVHPGNSAATDTSGCVLVGLNRVKGGLVDSAKTYLELVDHYVLPAVAKGEPIYLTIV